MGHWTIKPGGGRVGSYVVWVGDTNVYRPGGSKVYHCVPPPRTSSKAQTIQRWRMSYLSFFWTNYLETWERSSWRNYARDTVWFTKRLERARVSGRQAFHRTNIARLIVGLGVQVFAPILSGHAPQVSFTFEADPAGQFIRVQTISLPWLPTNALDYVIFYMGRPARAGSVKIPSTGKFLGIVAGNPVSPPTFPVSFPSPWRFRSGQRITLLAKHFDFLGRVGEPYFHGIFS